MNHLNRFFRQGFGIVGAGFLLIPILAICIHLFFNMGPLGFFVFLLIFFFIGSAVTSR
jgi:hypothetical protein